METLENILITVANVKVIDSSIPKSAYKSLDLSDNSPILSGQNLKTAVAYERFLEAYLEQHKAKVAYGGYIEKRNLYERSSIFATPQQDERNIHIGLDLWTTAGSPVLSALDGTIHSFQNNTGLGDYGPTLILKHTLKNHTFYTLYGHLSLESLDLWSVGQSIAQGEIIATLGTAAVNGDYAPHLHFQIIKDIQHFKGDYPGVCSEKDLAYYAANCPDPNLLLQLKSNS